MKPVNASVLKLTQSSDLRYSSRFSGLELAVKAPQFNFRTYQGHVLRSGSSLQ